MTAAFNQMLAQGVTPIKFENPVNQMAQLMQLKNAQQTGVVNQMAIDKGQRQQADQATLRNMLGQTGFNVNDPAQRAQLLGYEGGPEIVSALDTSAKTQRDVSKFERELAQEEEDAAVKSYTSSLAFRNSPEQILAAHDAAVAGSPVLQRAFAKNPRGLPGAREDLARMASTPEGRQALEDKFRGQTPESRATIAKLRAQELKALRPDTPPAAPQKIVKFENGQAYEYDPVTGIIRPLILTGGVPATGGAVAGATSATGFPVPPKPAPTESESAAGGAATRILGALDLINDAVTADPDATSPTGPEAFVSGIPVVRRATPSLQSGQRQVVENSFGDLVDAALYLATGASATPAQKEAAIASYSPAYSDKPEELAAKKQRLITLAKSAKIRAGRAWTPELDAKFNTMIDGMSDGAGGIPEGATATGPNGQKIVFKGGQWQPIQ